LFLQELLLQQGGEDKQGVKDEQEFANLLFANNIFYFLQGNAVIVSTREDLLEACLDLVQKNGFIIWEAEPYMHSDKTITNVSNHILDLEDFVAQQRETGATDLPKKTCSKVKKYFKQNDFDYVHLELDKLE